MRSLLARCRRSAVNWLIAFGQIWVYIPPTAPPASPAPTGPAPGHPERLCPEVPLSEVEMALLRQLLGVSGEESYGAPGDEAGPGRPRRGTESGGTRRGPDPIPGVDTTGHHRTAPRTPRPPAA
ncbi:DUF6059 family protein [Streptomyces sp. AK02-01A]|uniref:DUF6059 family protein n=1 Tax=Streptomyces sp. AK02-01A TaxID=3028648 RepID=UPI0029AA2B35|nr:DUF6059 family protein [Streptomyces sp. AK02-01A]MDX3854758.1 hypothetical protein [Streptomyces sp. AK02-01A]